MPNVTATPNILTDPGFVFWAPIGTAEPTNTVAGSVFTDAWPVAWVNLGATEDGTEWNYDIKVEQVRAAEFFDPIRWKTTERSGSIGFALLDFTLKNLSRTLNSGTSAVTTVSGTGATLLSKFEPVDPGNEVRCMIGWESLDATLRLVCRQTISSGGVKVNFKPGANKAAMAATFNFEVPSAAKPFAFYSAGANRVGS